MYVILIASTGGGRSVGMVRSRTKATEFSFSFLILIAFPLQQWLQERASISTYTYSTMPALFSKDKGAQGAKLYTT